jgi:uncharacterized coiled-coil DUF342 family protein
MNMASSTILDDLFLAGQEANTSVMGPDHAETLRHIVTDDTDFITELHAATTKARDDNDSSDLLDRLKDMTTRVTAQAEEYRKTKAKEFSKQLKAAKKQISMPTGTNDYTTRRMNEARKTFEDSLATISGLATKISKTDKKINRLNTRIGLLCEGSDSSSADSDSKSK